MVVYGCRAERASNLADEKNMTTLTSKSFPMEPASLDLKKLFQRSNPRLIELRQVGGRSCVPGGWRRCRGLGGRRWRHWLWRWRLRRFHGLPPIPLPLEFLQNKRISSREGIGERLNTTDNQRRCAAPTSSSCCRASSSCCFRSLSASSRARSARRLSKGSSFQIRTVRSADPVARIRPSGENAAGAKGAGEETWS